MVSGVGTRYYTHPRNRFLGLHVDSIKLDGHNRHSLLFVAHPFPWQCPRSLFFGYDLARSSFFCLVDPWVPKTLSCVFFKWQITAALQKQGTHIILGYQRHMENQLRFHVNFEVEAQDRPRLNKLIPNFNESSVSPPGLGYPSCTIMMIMNDNHAMMTTTRTMTVVVI